MNLTIFIIVIFFGVICAFYLPALEKKKALISGLSQRSPKKNRYSRLLIIYFLVFILLCVTRLPSFADTSSYVEAVYLKYQIQSFTDFFINLTPFEIGFDYLSKICYLIFGDAYWLYLAVFPILNLIILSKALKNNKNKNLILFLYIAFYGFRYNLDVLRGGIAITFIILAFLNKEKKKLKALLYILLGFLFHRTILIALLMFLPNKKAGRRTKAFYIIFLTIILVIYLTQIMKIYVFPVLGNLLLSMSLPEFVQKWVWSILNPQNHGIAPSVIIFYLITCIIILNKDNNKECGALLNFMMFGFVIIMFLPGEAVVLRLFDYFFIPAILLIPATIKKQKLLFQQLFVLLIFLFKIYSIVQLSITYSVFF